MFTWRVFYYSLLSLLPMIFTNTNHFGGAIISVQHPIIEFQRKNISFDTITAGEKVIRVFPFKNLGPGKLRIIVVQAGDGGTVAWWPKTTFLPGENNSIKIEFGYTASRSGYQDKIFTVISNAKNNPVVLHVTGYIKIK